MKDKMKDEMPPEYWVKQAKEGMNIAECWQGIARWYEQNEIKEAYKQGVQDCIDNLPDAPNVMNRVYKEETIQKLTQLKND